MLKHRIGRLGAAIAFLALAMQLAFPAGFMAGPPASSAQGFAVVICTGQGPLVVDLQAPSPAGPKTAPAKRPASCPFAGHGLLSPPPAPTQAAASPLAYAPPASDRAHAEASPGRGLAAPPPPAIGPPLRV